MSRACLLAGVLVLLVVSTRDHRVPVQDSVQTQAGNVFLYDPSWNSLWAAEWPLIDGLNVWNFVSPVVHNAYMGWHFTGGTSVCTGQYDGLNVISWTDLPPGVVAMACRAGNLSECDIVIGRGPLWELGALDFVNTIAHEVGHCMGFEHSDAEDSIMRPYTTTQRWLSWADRAAVWQIGW